MSTDHPSPASSPVGPSATLTRIVERMEEEAQERSGQAEVYRQMREWGHEESSAAEAKALAKWVKALRAALRPSEGPTQEVAIEMRFPCEISGRLGIGAEAWVELLDIEKRGIAQRNNDRSGMSIGWRTFKTVMNALRHCGEKHYVNPRPSEGPQERQEPT